MKESSRPFARRERKGNHISFYLKRGRKGPEREEIVFYDQDEKEGKKKNARKN